jgi:hypothetical protein
MNTRNSETSFVVNVTALQSRFSNWSMMKGWMSPWTIEWM